MATAGSEAYHRYALKAAHPRSGLYVIRFETNGTSDPDGQEGDTGEITVTRASKNLYYVTCSHLWATVICMSCRKTETSATTLEWLASTEGYDQVACGGACRIVDSDNVLEGTESDDETCEIVLLLSGAPLTGSL